jgi:radical SAM superfamily enzyme YgiQ (UPF0313 family)
MKIALINPSQNFENIYGSLSEEASVLPPLGLCYLASALKTIGFKEIKIFDAQALQISNKKAAVLALRWKANIIGITATTDTIYLASEMANFIKSKSKKTTIVVGGPHVSAVPEKTMSMFPSFNIGVIGEGENTFKELVLAIDAHKSLRSVRGIAYRYKKNILITKPRDFIKDLDVLPLPNWGLLPKLSQFYKPTFMNYKKLPSASLVTSRGCPGQCAFCDTRVFGYRYRVHSTEYVLKAIRYLVKTYGIKDICFYDDVFTIFRQRLVEICAGLSKMSLTWSCQARVNAVDYQTMKMMKNAGCWKISFGIESASPKVLKLMNKHISINQAKKAVSQAHQAGLEVEGYFILGFFGENKNTLVMTKKFILNSDLDIILLSYFLPFPGSPAYPFLEKYGRFHEDWRNLNAFDSDTPQFIPKDLTNKDLASAQKDIYRSFYFRPKILKKYALRIIKNPTEAVGIGRTFLNFSKFIFKP